MLSVRGFLLTCVCSNALRAAAGWRIYLFLHQPGCCECSPPSPSCVPGFAHAGHRHSQHVHHIQGASELLCGWATAHPCSVSTLPWPAQKNPCLHNLIFKPKQGWLKSWGSLLPLPQILWEGNSGHSALGSTTLRGCTEPFSWTFHPFSWTFHPFSLDIFTPSAPSLFYFTVRGQKKNAALKKEKKKEAQILGTF